jgi:glutathione S-transferase
MPRIFYMPRTRSSRVLWALHEIGAPFDATRIAPEERRSPEHLARQPLGRVPALELDDGTMMFESGAIMLQLGDLQPESGLLPAVGSSEPPDAASESREARRFNDAATAYADALADRPWILGAQFTLADIVCVGVLGSAESRGLLGRWPTLSEYVARGEARPAHLAAVAYGD